MHKVDSAVEAFLRDSDGPWYLTMRCGLELPLVPEKRLRAWTHAQDHLVTCQVCRNALEHGDSGTSGASAL